MELESAACCEVHIPEQTTTAAVVKPGGGRGRKKRQRIVEKTASTSISSSVNSFSVDDWERRELFCEQWAKIEAKLLEETSAFFVKYVKLLYDFICRYCGGGQSSTNYHQQVGFNYGMLPVAMISLSTYSKMTQIRIHAEVEEMLAATNSTKNNNIHRLCLNSFNLANMSTLLQATFNGLISDKVCEERNLDGGHWKNMSFDVVIKLWLESNSSKDKDKSSPPSLVIFVFDFETVNKETLLTLILLLKGHIHRAAISLVFFFAAQHNQRSLHYYLPPEATDHLTIEDLEPFYEPELISRLLETLVVEESLFFRLHPTMLRALAAHTTAAYEFTFGNLFLLLKSLVFEHFYSSPLSVVCQEPQALKRQLLTSGNQRLLQLLKNSLPLAANDDSDDLDVHIKKEEEDDDYDHTAYITRLTTQLEDFHAEHGRFTLTLQMAIDLLHFAHCLKSSENAARSNSSNTFLNYYCDSVTNPGYNFEEDLLSPLLHVSEGGWKTAMRRLLAKYRDFEEEEELPLITLLTDYQTKLIDLLRQEAEEAALQQARNKKLGLEIDMVASHAMATVVKKKLRSVSSRAEWRQTLKSQTETSKKNLQPFEQWKADLVAAMASALKNTSPATHRRHRLLAEALFYRNLEHFRAVHQVCTREQLARTLSQKGHRSFEHCYPNSFILYQLYREAAPVVNLADWYAQFGEEKRMTTGGGSKTDGKATLSDDELTVHFSTTLSDFDYIGLLQSSRYKAECLNRLAWF